MPLNEDQNANLSRNASETLQQFKAFETGASYFSRCNRSIFAMAYWTRRWGLRLPFDARRNVDSIAIDIAIVRFYDFPEMADNDPDDPEVGCYAVTEHPQLRLHDGDTLVVTYACNRYESVVPSVDDLDLYYPRTLTVDLAGYRPG